MFVDKSSLLSFDCCSQSSGRLITFCFVCIFILKSCFINDFPWLLNQSLMFDAQNKMHDHVFLFDV